MKFKIAVAALLFAWSGLHVAHADTCQMYTGTPPTSANGDGTMGNLTCNKKGQITVNATTTPSGTQDINVTQVGGNAVTTAVPVNDPGLPDTLGQKTMANSTSFALASDQSAVPVSGTVTSNVGTPAVGITPTDRTITSASGASQTLMAANASRHSLLVVNTGNANCGVNPTGGTAAIGGAGTFTLVPNGSYSPRIPTLSAVTVICTAAQPVYADEN